MNTRATTRSCFFMVSTLATALACDAQSREAGDGASHGGEPTQPVAMAAVHADAAARMDADSVEASFPDAPAASFPAAQCRSGYAQRGSRLCISGLRQAANYATATSNCRNSRGHVCTYEDMLYLYLNSSTDANYNTYARWLGNVVADDRILCGNRQITSNNDSDIWNFDDDDCNQADYRRYWCCHDRS